MECLAHCLHWFEGKAYSDERFIAGIDTNSLIFPTSPQVPYSFLYRR